MSDGETCDDGALNANGYGELPCATRTVRTLRLIVVTVFSMVEACDDGDRQDDGNGCSVSCQRTYLAVMERLNPTETYDGNIETETCAYGQESCIVCVGLTIKRLKVQIWMLRKAVSLENASGPGGDGVLQQVGLIGGGILESESDYARDSGAWEGSDPGTEDLPVARLSVQA